MRLTISRTAKTYFFDPRHLPAATVNVGATVVFETMDCFDGQVRTEADVAASIDMSHINPNTGPLEIRGAEPGDVLVVKVLDIKPGDRAIAALIPGAGLLKNSIPGPKTKVCPIRDGRTVFSEDIVIEPRLMVGTLGTTPVVPIPTGFPGDHGGNIDVPMVGIGSTAYLPVFVPGALFQLGDVHSAMGDGECSVTGMECGADVTIEVVRLIRGRTMEGPLVETDTSWGLVASARTLEDAVRLAVRRAAAFLSAHVGLGGEEAALLTSAACDVRIAQWADANYDAVAYVVIPKYLDRKGRLDTF